MISAAFLCQAAGLAALQPSQMLALALALLTRGSQGVLGAPQVRGDLRIGKRFYVLLAKEITELPNKLS